VGKVRSIRGLRKGRKGRAWPSSFHHFLYVELVSGGGRFRVNKLDGDEASRGCHTNITQTKKTKVRGGVPKQRISLARRTSLLAHRHNSGGCTSTSVQEGREGEDRGRVPPAKEGTRAPSDHLRGKMRVLSTGGHKTSRRREECKKKEKEFFHSQAHVKRKEARPERARPSSKNGLEHPYSLISKTF